MNANNDSTTITIVGRQDLENLGLLQNIFEKRKVKVLDLAQEMKHVLSGLQQVLADLPDFLGGFRLSEMKVALEISAKGSVSVLGTGGEASGKGGITLTLTKETNSQASQKSLAPTQKPIP